VSGDTAIGPFADPSEDMAHLHLTYHANTDEYTLTTEIIVSGFSHPVDAEIDSNAIYVLEWGFTGTAGLYKVTFPAHTAGVPEQNAVHQVSCYPNPATSTVSISFPGNNTGATLTVFDMKQSIITRTSISDNRENKFHFSTEDLKSGIYFYEISTGGCQYHGKFAVVK
jgi:hypothetical protein